MPNGIRIAIGRTATKSMMLYLRQGLLKAIESRYFTRTISHLVSSNLPKYPNPKPSRSPIPCRIAEKKTEVFVMRCGEMLGDEKMLYGFFGLTSYGFFRNALLSPLLVEKKWASSSSNMRPSTPSWIPPSTNRGTTGCALACQTVKMIARVTK